LCPAKTTEPTDVQFGMGRLLGAKKGCIRRGLDEMESGKMLPLVPYIRRAEFDATFTKLL